MHTSFKHHGCLLMLRQSFLVGDACSDRPLHEVQWRPCLAALSESFISCGVVGAAHFHWKPHGVDFPAGAVLFHALAQAEVSLPKNTHGRK